MLKRAWRVGCFGCAARAAGPPGYLRTLALETDPTVATVEDHLAQLQRRRLAGYPAWGARCHG